MAIAGLNMRSMDLDNIIEEDGDCKKWLLELIEHYDALHHENDSGKQIYMGGFDEISEEFACFIKEKIINLYLGYERHDSPHGFITLECHFDNLMEFYFRVEDKNKRRLFSMLVHYDPKKDFGRTHKGNDTVREVIRGENEYAMKVFTSLKKFFNFIRRGLGNGFVGYFNMEIQYLDMYHLTEGESEYDSSIYK